MKIKNIILVVEFILIVIMGCVSFTLIKEDIQQQSTTFAEEEEHFSTPEELGIEELSSSDTAQVNTSDGTIIPAPPVVIEPIETTQHIEETPETTTETAEDETTSLPEDIRIAEEKLNIVVYGDSIWDDKRYEDSVANHLAGFVNANVYNCAMGGTSASLISESTQIENWDSRSLNGMVYIATDRADSDIQLAGYPANDVEKTIDYNEVDYFIFSYGLNDYFNGVDVTPKDMLDMTSYVGALRHATQVMKQTYPNAKFLLISPTYCQFINLDGSVIDCMEKDFGGGTLPGYVKGIEKVSEEYSTLYLDAFHTFGINYDTAPIYLRDGVHFTEEGRLLYARKVADFILSVENN